MAQQLDRATKQQIIEKVCGDYKADGLQPNEVIVKQNGEVWIDRSGRDARNVPFIVGHWS